MNVKTKLTYYEVCLLVEALGKLEKEILSKVQSISWAGEGNYEVLDDLITEGHVVHALMKILNSPCEFSKKAGVEVTYDAT